MATGEAESEIPAPVVNWKGRSVVFRFSVLSYSNDRDVLIRNGYRVLEASRSSETLQMVRTFKEEIALLLTDVILPDTNGVELAAHLWQLQPAIKVLYMSGYTDDSIVKQGLLAPRTAFLQKLVSPKYWPNRFGPCWMPAIPFHRLLQPVDFSASNPLERPEV